MNESEQIEGFEPSEEEERELLREFAESRGVLVQVWDNPDDAEYDNL